MNDSSVLISGASSGIGKACALLLSRKGFRVFAGVRNNSDRRNLQKEAPGKLIPLLLDVTDPISIEDSRNKISDVTDSTLFALINNAGIGFGGPLETLSVAEVRRLFDVNVIGAFAVTSAFIPLLRNRGEGRIINMGSMSGILSLPGLSAYAASKYALEAITDSLRLELNPFNISVSIIEPGNVDTPIWEKSVASFDDMIRNAEDETHRLYSSLISSLRKYSENPNGISSDKVADLVYKILISKKPKNRYLLGKDAVMFRLINLAPDIIRDKIISWLIKT